MTARVTFEFDTAQELEAFLSRFQGRPPKRTGKAGRVFRETDIEALVALADTPEGMGTGELAQTLGVGTHQLPPIIGGWNRRARANGVSFGDILSREAISDGGKPASVYRLTEQGKELVKKERELGKATES